MNKLLLALALLGGVACANEIALPIEKTQNHTFKKSVALNAQVVQLSNAQQSITSLVSGHLEQYFVKPAQNVKKGQKIALIESIEVSKMSADYIALKKQLASVSKNYDSIQKLYEQGMASMQKLNDEAIKKSEISAKLNALRSQLATLGIDAESLKKATSNFYLRSHSDGRVSALLKPLHSSVNPDEGVVSIVKNQAYYLKSYLPIEYATKVRLGDRVTFFYAGKEIVTHITQIMPKVDEQTQRVIVLSSVDENVENMFIDVYVKSTLYFGDATTYVAVKKSALSFFNNEWVVFVPNEEDKEHEEQEHHEQEESGEDHEGEHEEEHGHEVPYKAQVVEVLTSDEEFVAVEGLELGEEYVSDKSYYVKSMMLKSSLGEHGH